RGDVETSRGEGAVDRDDLAQVGARNAGALAPGDRGADEARHPFFLLEQPRFEEGGVAVRSGLSILIPRSHLPMVATAGSEGRSLVGDVDGSIAVDLAGVPDVALVVLELGRRRCNDDLVRRLVGPSPRILHYPREARLGDVDAERVGEILRAQL